MPTIIIKAHKTLRAQLYHGIFQKSVYTFRHYSLPERMLKVHLGNRTFLLSKKTGFENFPSGNVWNPHQGGHPPLSFKN